jgi:hypothetical protein
VRQLEQEEVTFKDAAENVILLSVFESKITKELLDKWQLYLLEQEEKEALILEVDIDEAAACGPLKVTTTVVKFLQFCDSRTQALESSDAIHKDGVGPGNRNKDGKVKGRFEEMKKKSGGGNGGGGGNKSAPSPAGKENKKPDSSNVDKPKKKKKKKLNQGPPLASRGFAATTVSDDEEAEATVMVAKTQVKRDTKPALNHFKTGCVWCGGAHPHKGCGKINSLSSPNERFARLRERIKADGREICYSCFDEHKSPDCPKSSACGVGNPPCTKRHHRLLHKPSDI